MIRVSIWWIFDWFSRRAKRLRPQKRSASISVFSSAAALLCTKCSLQFKPTFMLLLNLFYHVKPSSHIPAAISDGMGFYELGIRHIQGPISIFREPIFQLIPDIPKNQISGTINNDPSLIPAIHPSHHFFFQAIEITTKRNDVLTVLDFKWQWGRTARKVSLCFRPP